MWYNSTSKVIKGFTSNPAGSWATGGTLNSARFDFASSVSSPPTSALVAGGATPTGVETESYNGTSFSEVNDLNTGRFSVRGSGNSNTAALAFGGYGPPPSNVDYTNTESWNGSSWTEVNDLNSARQQMGSSGTQTAALAFGGNPSPVNASTESWNGSSWTEVNDLNTGRSQIAGFGLTNTAALGQGSSSIPTGSLTESWNGSTWTETTDINTPRRSQSGGGTYTSGLVFGGETPAAASVDNTETWNGSAWTETTDLLTAVRAATGTGTSVQAAMCIGGADSPGTARDLNQEFTSPTTSTVTFTAS
tara:strand:- start:16 stop:933 length:918 start_codon:yes stop_codon:yes gene_type:complete